MMNIPNSKKNIGTTIINIEKIENQMKVKFPNIYKEILQWSNGCIINDRILIYSIDEIKERNDTMEIGEYASSYVAIGDTGGEFVILMKQEVATHQAYIVDIGDLDVTNPYCIITDIYTWMQEGGIIED